MGNFHTQQPKTTYLGLMARTVSELNGEPFALSEQRLRASLQVLGYDAVLTVAEQPAPTARWKRFAQHLRRDKRGLLHELINEVFTAAGCEPPTFDASQALDLEQSVYAHLSAQRGVNHGIHSQ